MIEYKEHNEKLDIPRGAGVEGFIAAIRRILQLPRVQKLTATAAGKVHYTRLVRPDEPLHPVGVDFESLLPSSIMRNGNVKELPEIGNAAYGICSLFKEAAQEHVVPVAFASGAASGVLAWHEDTTGIPYGDDGTLYGLPLLVDEGLPKEALFLCCGYSKAAALVDVRQTYRITLPLKYGVSNE